MKKIWLDHYPPDYPEDIDAEIFASVPAMFTHMVSRYGNRPAISNQGCQLTYLELDRLARAFAAYLQQVLKLEKGDRIALMLPNIMQFPVAFFGAMRAGLIIVNINPFYTPRELKHQINDAGVHAILIWSENTKVLLEIMDDVEIEHVIVTVTDDLLSDHENDEGHYAGLATAINFNTALRLGKALTLQPVDIAGDDLLLLQYTSGTTGNSKGAMLTHRNIVANLEQFVATKSPAMEEGGLIAMLPLPLFHIFGLVSGFLSVLRMGGVCVMVSNPRDLDSIIAEFNRWPFNYMVGVNTLYNALVNDHRFTDRDFSRLETCIIGGAALQQSVGEKWLAVTGTLLREGYGLSETSPVLTVNPYVIESYNGSVGLPVPGTEISIRDVDNKEVPFGEPGELCARGPQVMSGYWNRETATAEVFTDDGFFRTGDIATMDEYGFVRIVDRKKDIINVSGFNVSPNEIEDVLGSHGQVLECGCIGVPDTKTGEAVAVFIVLRNSEVEIEALNQHCIENLARYKVPKHYRFLDALPKNSVGKILRRELKQRFAEQSG